MATERLAPILHYLRRVTSATAGGDIPDAELLSRFRLHRDETAFSTLVRRHGPMVFAVCRRVLGDGHAAEDAFQATFFVLARKDGALARPELLANWLHGVAYRTAVRAKSEAAKRRFHERQAVRTQEIEPDMECEWRDLRTVLDEEVNRLPERYRVPVVLCYLQGQTNAEAARRLRCSRGTIATLLARAREKLRRRLMQRGVGLSIGFEMAALTPIVRAGAVPLALEQQTVKAALLLASGQMQVVGALAAQSLALAKGVSKAMLMEKLRIPVVVLLMTALVGTGAGISAYCAGAWESEAAEIKTEAKSRPQERTEKPREHVAAPAEPTDDEKVVYQTPNFIVTAPSAQIARQVGQAAEHNRRVLARLWLGEELADWSERCPVRVTIAETPNSAAQFGFQDGVVSRGGMFLEGPLDRILADLLPHEMTHTILAQWRGSPLPRWADEGAAMLSESAIGRTRHEQAMEKLLRSGRLIPLTKLLPKLDYPKDTKDVAGFYAQSLSLADFLVRKGSRKRFLDFVVRGQDEGWDEAAHSVYGFKTVALLEEAWLAQARMQLADKRADSPRQSSVAQENRQMAPRPAPAAGEALPAQFKEQLPLGPAPIQALVVLHKDRRLSVSRKIIFYEPETETVTLKNGQKHPVTYYAEKYNDYSMVYDFRKVRIYDTHGRPVDGDKLRQRLTKETVALISANGRPVDPKHLQLYKEDTLVFVLPPAASSSRAGRSSIAPPPTPLDAPPSGSAPAMGPFIPSQPMQPPPLAGPAGAITDSQSDSLPSRP